MVGATVGRSWAAPGSWRVRRCASRHADAPVRPVTPKLADLMRAARVRAHGSEPSSSAGWPDQCAEALGSLTLDAVLERRGGLPSLSAMLNGTASAPLRVCYLGGSVTEQRGGYRPRVTEWLQRAGATAGVQVEEVPAFCGNCGSKVLAFMVADWVIARRPHLVFVELAINDGDTLLETEDAMSLGSAYEGIVRHIRDALPNCELCALHMFVRDELPLAERTGSKAWADNADADAPVTYHERIPRLHGRVCAHYDVPSISLVPVMSRMPHQLRRTLFRDDCHFQEPGAAFAAAAICAALEALVEPNARGCSPPSLTKLPSPLHARPWGRGRAEPVEPAHLSFFYVSAPPPDADAKARLERELLARHTQLDLDPLDNSQRKAWWLLYPGDTARVRFRGTRLGILTMVGPDSGILTCEIDEGASRCRVNLCDRWSYFWRLAVVTLAEELPKGEHVATLRLEAEVPDRSIMRRPPSGPVWHQCKREGKEHKLWLMHWLIEESSDMERAVVPRPESQAARGHERTRLGGAGLATGGRNADG